LVKPGNPGTFLWCVGFGVFRWLEVDDDSELDEDVDEDESLSESDDDDSSEDEEDVEELEVEDGVAVLFGTCRTTRDISSAAKVRRAPVTYRKHTILSLSLLANQRARFILDPEKKIHNITRVREDCTYTSRSFSRITFKELSSKSSNSSSSKVIWLVRKISFEVRKRRWISRFRSVMLLLSIEKVEGISNHAFKGAKGGEERSRMRIAGMGGTKSSATSRQQ
jgi:hypothetical protein